MYAPARSLEGLIRDASTVAIRQIRAQRFYLNCRKFGHHVPARRLESTARHDVEKVSISFDGIAKQLAQKDTPFQCEAQVKASSMEQVDETTTGDGDDEDWHAQVELNLRNAQKATTSQGGDAAVSGHGHNLGIPIDEAASAISRNVAAGTTLQAQPTRYEGRRLRKQRRIESGKANKPRLSTVSTAHPGVNPEETSAGGKGLKEGTHTKSEDQGRDESPRKTAGAGRPAKEGATQEVASEETTKPKKEPWQVQKAALQRKFGDQGWQPRKRVSPDTLEGIRALHQSDPNTYSTETLAKHFEITPEAIRRILKSKWKPNSQEIEARMERWEKRGLQKWGAMAEQGVKPPKKWRAMGVPNPNLVVPGEADESSGTRRRRTRSRVGAMRSNRSWIGSGNSEGSLAERIL